MTTKKVSPPRTEEPEEIRKYREQAVSALNVVYARVTTAQSDMSATGTTTEIIADLNSLLAILRTAGLMVT